ncbi:hypothetical protein ACFQ1S_34240, partial [Kibdelosporangium lantanae]
WPGGWSWWTGTPWGSGPCPDRCGASAEPAVDIESVLRELKKDPSLRFTDSGRALLRWLDAHTCGLDQWDELPKDNIPAHCVPAMVKLAQHNMEFWERLGKLLAEDADIDSA